MAVTTSVFPNLNTFTHGPEFCVLFRKLQSTCHTSKSATLSERYPKLCKSLEANPNKICTTKSDTKGDIISDEKIVWDDDIANDPNGHSINFNDKLTMIIYRYARENLALVNVYIKDPAVTRIKRDQKVPLIWFVANVGGILGLTMGMSLVTFFEIIHHAGYVFFQTGAKSLATVRRTMTGNDIGGQDIGGGQQRTEEQLQLPDEASAAIVSCEETASATPGICIDDVGTNRVQTVLTSMTDSDQINGRSRNGGSTEQKLSSMTIYVPALDEKKS